MRMGRVVTGIGAAALLTACGGGGSGGGDGESDPDHPLTGSWFGTADILTDAGGYATITMEINSDGALTSSTVRGDEIDSTAEPTEEESGFYVYEDDAGGEFFLRPEGNYAFYADGGDVVAILERGVDSLPDYSITDITGEYEATEYGVDSVYNLEYAVDGEAEITGDSDPLSFGAFSSETGCGSSGLLSLASSIYGVYVGTFQNVSGDDCFQSGSIKAYLSPDKQKALYVSCLSFSFSDVPQNCGFGFGTKE